MQSATNSDGQMIDYDLSMHPCSYLLSLSSDSWSISLLRQKLTLLEEIQNEDDSEKRSVEKPMG